MSTLPSFHVTPGQEVSPAQLQALGADHFFTLQPIPDSIFALMQGRSYRADCPLPRQDLRYLTCLHCDAQGRTLMGEMVVHVSIADDVLSILRQLYQGAYPIERMVLIDHYEADDETSMRANNSSGFNFRYVSHTHIISKHGRGLAIDINPLYNPYHKTLPDGTIVTEPANATAYLDRQRDFPYKIVRGDLCYRLFTSHGFHWGGNWRTRKDYQHFER